MRKLLTKTIIIVSLLLPAFVMALELSYPEIGPSGQKIKIELNMNLNQLIAWFYYFIITISGIAAFGMIVWGGFIWLTSVGSPAKISDARDKISSAVTGLVLILASYLILQVVNPDLTTLRLPELPPACAPGCQFLPLGPCPPAKPNQTPISGGICCCP